MHYRYYVFAALLNLLGVSALQASTTASLPEWIKGDTNCSIDKRPARMYWEIVNTSERYCDTPSSCTVSEGAAARGRFSDNGGAWVALERSSSTSTSMNIRYLGAEPANWFLAFNASTQVAEGWTTWHGKRYELSCWKGAEPLTKRCQHYAETAVQQYASAQRLFCGFTADARWQDNEHVHYEWCRQKRGDEASLASETQARARAIADCRRKQIRIDRSWVNPATR
jgi:hypothetical protein